jgi:serine/threonine protein phosphatase PrpC
MPQVGCVVNLHSILGWRPKMEDACIINPNFTNKNFGLFAVFDGHGGSYII